MTADSAALLAAAIRACCLAKAPRRTVQAVAAAVTGVLVRSATDAAVPGAGPSVPAGPVAHDYTANDPGQLLDSLRAARRLQRKKKKERRKAAKLAAADGASKQTEGAAGKPVDAGKAPAGEPAQVPISSPPELYDNVWMDYASPALNRPPPGLSVDVLPGSAIEHGQRSDNMSTGSACTYGPNAPGPPQSEIGTEDGKSARRSQPYAPKGAAMPPAAKNVRRS